MTEFCDPCADELHRWKDGRRSLDLALVIVAKLGDGPRQEAEGRRPDLRHSASKPDCVVITASGGGRSNYVPTILRFMLIIICSNSFKAGVRI